MSSMEDTFNALRRTPINDVDTDMLAAFYYTTPAPVCVRDTYEIELVNDIDMSLFLIVLEAHHWSVKDYVKHSVIEWVIPEAL